jgi:hypothetical protein
MTGYGEESPELDGGLRFKSGQGPWLRLSANFDPIRTSRAGATTIILERGGIAQLGRAPRLWRGGRQVRSRLSLHQFR